MIKNKKVLITCGPTWVRIDSMRILSNQSTGTLGQMLAKDFAKAGAKVTLLLGPVPRQKGPKSIKVKHFSFFDEFSALIKKELQRNYDVCVHAAAVSDYKLKRHKQGKISSQLKRLKLEFVPTQKIIHQIKKLNPRVFLVGFKLEPSVTKTTAKSKSRLLFQKGRCDLVVANSLKGKTYSGFILDKNNKILAHKKTREQLSKTLVNRVTEYL